ncbi:tRNA intron endonuclease, catalytic C-terminal domain [Popillia japonica]
MELQEPRKKKNSKFKKYIPLCNLEKKISSYFNGFSIIIENIDGMKTIYERGFFGKANLSRSCPIIRQNEIIRKRQYLRRCKWESKDCKNIKKVIVVPDSDTDDDNYFVNLKPEYQIDRSPMKEKLCLSLVEAYYLSNYIKCLNVYCEDTLLSQSDMWQKFSETDTCFVSNYAIYKHFRRKGWVVKPGIKFGGDYILYKAGPPYYHASYVVIIDIVNEDLSRKKEMQRRSMDTVNIIGLNRLCETAGKELLICQLIWPSELIYISDQDLSKI